MNLRKIKKGFTLIELLVGITIMSIIVLGVTSIDFNRLSQNQKLDIFTNNVKSNYERIRNNSLAGKGIGASLDIPTKWTIDYATTSSGIIISKSYNGAVDTLYENINFQDGIYIDRLRCLQIDGVTVDNVLNISETGTIEITGADIKLLGDCTTNTSKILEISLTNKLDSKIIKINTLNGLVEIE